MEPRNNSRRLRKCRWENPETQEASMTWNAESPMPQYSPNYYRDDYYGGTHYANFGGPNSWRQECSWTEDRRGRMPRFQDDRYNEPPHVLRGNPGRFRMNRNSNDRPGSFREQSILNKNHAEFEKSTSFDRSGWCDDNNMDNSGENSKEKKKAKNVGFLSEKNMGRDMFLSNRGRGRGSYGGCYSSLNLDLPRGGSFSRLEGTESVADSNKISTENPRSASFSLDDRSTGHLSKPEGTRAPDTRKDKLELSLKASRIIDDVLKGGTGRISDAAATTSLSKNLSAEHDHGAFLLDKAENLRRELREKRAIAKLDARRNDRRKQTTESSLSEQIDLLTKRSMARVKGFLDKSFAPADTTTSSSHSFLGSSARPTNFNHGNKPNRNLSDSPKTTSITTARGHSKSPRPAAMLRAAKQQSDALNKDSLMKLVNSPRSRKERMQIAKMLQSHNKIIKHASRPKLHLQTGPDDVTSDSDLQAQDLNVEDLTDDVRAQILDLILNESHTGDNMADTMPDSRTDQDHTDDVQILDNVESDDDLVDITDSFTNNISKKPENTSTPSMRRQARLRTDTDNSDDSLKILDLDDERPDWQPDGRVEEVSDDLKDKNDERLSDDDDDDDIFFRAILDSEFEDDHLPGSIEKLQEVTSSEKPEMDKQSEVTSSSLVLGGDEKGENLHDCDKMDVSKYDFSVPAPLFVVEPSTVAASFQETQADESNIYISEPTTTTPGDLSPARAEKKRRRDICQIAPQLESVQCESKRQKFDATEHFHSKDKVEVDVTGEWTSDASDKDDRMNQVLILTLDEEEVRQKLKDADTAIERLNTIIRESQEQLERRLTMKDKLLKEEEELRSKRMAVLQGALAEKRLSRPLVSDVCSEDSSQPLAVSSLSALPSTQTVANTEHCASSVKNKVDVSGSSQAEAETSFTTVTNPTTSASFLAARVDRCDEQSSEQDNAIYALSDKVKDANIKTVDDVEMCKAYVADASPKSSNNEMSHDPDNIQPILDECDYSKRAVEPLSDYRAQLYYFQDPDGLQTSKTMMSNNGVESVSLEEAMVNSETTRTLETISSEPGGSQVDENQKDRNIGECCKPDDSLPAGGDVFQDCGPPNATSSCEESEINNVGTLHYVGTLAGQSGISPDILKKLAVNFADLKKTSYVFLDEATLRSHSSQSESETDCAMADLSATKRVTAEHCNAEATQVVEPHITALSSPTAKPSDSPFKIPYTPKLPDKSDKKSGKDKKEKPASNRENCYMTRSRQKASEFYPNPEVTSNKKLKSKKSRNKGSKLASDTLLDTSSDAPSTENLQSNGGDQKQRRKKKPKKELAKVLQEYLHADSSSDVEIQGLDYPKLSSSPVKSSSTNTHDSASDATNKQSKKSSAKSHGKFKKYPSTSPHAAPHSNVKATNIDKPLTTDDLTGAELQSMLDAIARKRNKKQKLKDLKASYVFNLKDQTIHTGSIQAIQIWGKKVVTAGDNGQIHIFNTRSNQYREFSAHSKSLCCMLVSALGGNGTRVYTGGSDCVLNISNFKKYYRIRSDTFRAQVKCIREGLAARVLYLGLSNGSVISYDPKTHKNVFTGKCSDNAISDIALAQQGRRHLLCVAAEDYSITLRDAWSNMLIRKLEFHVKIPIFLEVVGNLVYSGGADKTVQVHNIRNGDLEKTLRFDTAVNCLAVKGNTLAVGCQDATITCFSTRNYQLYKFYCGPGKKSAVTSIILDNSCLYAGNKDGELDVINLNSSEGQKCNFGRCDVQYGRPEDLLHHVAVDHVSQIQFGSRCLWEDCPELLGNAKENLRHVQSHIENTGTSVADKNS